MSDPRNTTETTKKTSTPCLGELLKTVTVLQSKAYHIKYIIYKSCKVQEGDTPPFKVDDLYEQYVSLIKSTRHVKMQIQQCNVLPHGNNCVSSNVVAGENDDKKNLFQSDTKTDDNDEEDDDGEVMMKLLVRKDIMKRHLSLLDRIIDDSFPSTSSFRKKIKDISQVNAVEYDTKYRELGEQIVDLELRIQKLNWK